MGIRKLFFIVCLLSILTACEGLASQPEIVATFAPAPTAIPIQVDNPEQLGQAIFEARCASCHGITGRGDGAVALQAGVTVPDFTDPATAQNQTIDEWIYTIREGRIENLMPPWKNSLSDEEIQAVAEYSYTMWENPIADPEPEIVAIQEATGTIFGDVIFGTVSADTDVSVSVGVHILDSTDNTVDFKLQVLEAGIAQYTFSEVPIRNDYTYLVSAIYQETAFYSEVVEGTPSTPDINIPVHVYEVTNDPSVIEMDLLFMYITQTGERMMVQQFMSFTNTSDKMYQGTTQVDDVRFDSVRVTLPVGAEILNTQELGTRFFISQSDIQQITLVDTDPVQPNSQHLVELVYSILLPANANRLELSYPIHYNLTNTPELLVQPDAFQISGNNFTATGAQVLDFGTFDSYLGQPIEQGDNLTLQIRLDGRRGLPQPPLAAIISIAIGVIMLAIGGVLLTVYGDKMTEEDLLAALVALDKRYEAGEIPENKYKAQRQKLKSKLAQIMN